MPRNFYSLFPGTGSNVTNKNSLIEIPKNTKDVSVVPSSGVAPLKTLDDWRALFHQLAPVIVTMLVGLHLVTEAQVTLWLPFVVAIADNLLAVGNTVDKIRKAIYAVLLLFQTGTAATTIIGAITNSPQVELYAPVITGGLTLITSILARFYSGTSTMIPKVEVPALPGLPIPVQLPPVTEITDLGQTIQNEIDGRLRDAGLPTTKSIQDMLLANSAYADRFSPKEKSDGES